MWRRNIFLSGVTVLSLLVLTSTASAQGNIQGDPWLFTAQDIIGGTWAFTAGTTSYDANPADTFGTYTVTASGHDIWNPQDAFRFLYIEASGDFSVSVAILGNPFQGGDNEWTKAGVMVRQSISPGAADVYQVVTRNPNNDHFCSFQWRDYQDVGAAWVGTAEPIETQAYPFWVRIRREGDTFFADYSYDGATWGHQAAAQRTVEMEDPVLVGICLTSHQDATLTTVQFTDFRKDGLGPRTRAAAGADQWCYGRANVTLDGSRSPRTTSYNWEQVLAEGDDVVQLSGATSAVCTFQAPALEYGRRLTFKLTVTGDTGTDSAETHVYVRAVNAPKVAPENLRARPVPSGFRLEWDPIIDAEQYGVGYKFGDLPPVWIYTTTAAYFDFLQVPEGTPQTLVVRGVNVNGAGVASEPLTYIVLGNAALAGGKRPPSEYVYVISHYDITGMNDGAMDDTNDSWTGAIKTEDYWGYLWSEPLYFDWIVYYTGDFFADGGWFTSLGVEYTEDGTTWKEVRGVTVTPAYDFRDWRGTRTAFTRYDISIPVLRGRGIRIRGTPGGTATFTSVSELETYGDQTRPASFLMVQGLDAEVLEWKDATLDGSFSFSTRGNIVSYSWEQTSGPTVAISNKNSAVASFAAPGVTEDTVLVFSLTASDGVETLEDSDVRITVRNVKATTASAGLDQKVTEGATVTLDGRGSVTVTGNLSYQWTQLPAETVTLSNPQSPVCTFAAPILWDCVKELTFQLQVDDGAGGVSTDEVKTVIVNSLFDFKPLPPGYFRDVLHLGNTPSDRFLAPLTIGTDYLTKWGGQANVNPLPGEEYDFSGTGITTTVNPMVWMPVHSDSGWFGQQPLDNFGQMYHIYIFSFEEREARVRYRHDDEMRLWNNAMLVASRDDWDNGAERADDFILHKGVNSITFRFEEGGGGNQIAVRITNRNDVEYTDLYYALSAPGPLPPAYGVRSLPGLYRAGTSLKVDLNVRVDPDNKPQNMTVMELLPSGFQSGDVIDSGGGLIMGKGIYWASAPDQIGMRSISYILRVPSDYTGPLKFHGTVAGPWGETNVSGDRVIYDYDVPTAPTELRVNMLAVGHLSWTGTGQEGVVGYRIYRSENGGPFVELAFVSGTYYEDDTVIFGNSYSYKVAAVTVEGFENETRETPPAEMVMEIREAEDLNYGGAEQEPGYGNCPPAVEAPDPTDFSLDYNFYYATDIPVDDARRAYRPDDNVCTAVYIGWVTVGDWWRFTFEVPAPGPEDPPGGWVKLVFRFACPNGGVANIYWDDDYTPVGSVTFVTGAWDIFQYFEMEPFQTSPGTHLLRVSSAEGEMNFDRIGIAYNWVSKRQNIFYAYFDDYPNDQAVRNAGWQILSGPQSDPLAAWRLTEDPSVEGVNGKCMMSNSDVAREAILDEQLISPEMNCTDWLSVRLDFKKNFRVWGSDTAHQQIGDVDIRVRDAGGTWGSWVNLLRFDRTNVADVDSSAQQVDIASYADGNSIQLRWHFYDVQNDYWFAVDEIAVSGEKKPEEKPLPPVIEPVAGKMRLTWQSFGSGSYTVEYTDDLASGMWSTAAGPISATSWDGEDVTSFPYRFYRVRSD